MIVNVAAILKEYGGKVPVNGDIEIGETDFLGERFVFTKPLSLTGSIVNNGSTLELSSEAKSEIKVRCARCGRELTVDIAFPIHDLFAEEDDTLTPNEDIVLFTGTKIDMKDIAVNHFLMNVPGKFLCSDNCKGLCAKCGKDLNDGDCDCSKDEIDPRWAALADIMKQSDND